jgi:3-hydroxyisobutyrate dehydrogenase-like beta-hydroxyacid dehydrogenase
MAQLGFVGTGTMGQPMAGHLVDAGHGLRVFDRVAEATSTLVDRGAESVAAASTAADGAECVFLSLPGPEHVEAAVIGPAGVLAAPNPPAMVVDLSTNSVEMVRALRTRCDDAGVAFVDAPVSGGLVRARAGTLSVMVGATAAEFERVRPLLDCFGEHVFHVGDPGTGTIAKLVNNQVFLAAGAVVQEAFVLATAAGLDPAALLPVLKASSAGPYLALAPLLLGRAFDDVIFRLDIAAKDLDLAVASGSAVGADLPVTTAAAELYAAAVGAGFGAEVFHVTLRELERRAGVEVPVLRRPEKRGTTS